MDLKIYLKRQAIIVERALNKFIPKGKDLMISAMRYSLLAGGKRLRPILVMEGARVCGGSVNAVLPAACALECIHTYSLIHDDLPAMDDDDLRRGKPTSHRKYGEAAAILAGDALLTEAFRLLAQCEAMRGIEPKSVVEATTLLAEAAGYRGMIRGQAADTIESERWKRKNRETLKGKVEQIHLDKTAALIRASLLVGAVLSGGTRRQRNALDEYGRCIGLAFQIADDMLDIAGNKKLLGKTGSDIENGKLTYPALYGMSGAGEKAYLLADQAKQSLSFFSGRADVLRALADYVVHRKW